MESPIGKYGHQRANDTILYWAISVLGLFLLLWFLKDRSFNMISILIFFLAAITFPHVIVMSKLEDEA